MINMDYSFKSTFKFLSFTSLEDIKISVFAQNITCK